MRQPDLLAGADSIQIQPCESLIYLGSSQAQGINWGYTWASVAECLVSTGAYHA